MAFFFAYTAWYTVAMRSILFLSYLRWHYLDATRDILKGWGNILWFILNYFSVLLLLRTLFSPWRGIQWRKRKGFYPGDMLFTLMSNLISRILGAIVRSFLIVAGLLGEAVFFVLGASLLIFWLFLPFLIFIGFIYGILLLV